jgi:hypothetical protein
MLADGLYSYATTHNLMRKRRFDGHIRPRLLASKVGRPAHWRHAVTVRWNSFQ